MVGDNLHADIARAQALGIRTVWVDWEGKGLPEGQSHNPGQHSAIHRGAD